MNFQKMRYRIAGPLIVSLLIFLPVFSVSSVLGDTVLQSGTQQVALVELYTSQGCSSCPPADNWLSGLKDDRHLWDKFIPLAFHVDYWDYIGWQDPFAQPEFGQRQRTYEDEGALAAVYTPGVLLNGAPWRGWAKGENPRSTESAAGSLRIEFDDAEIRVEFTPVRAVSGDLRVHVAILGFDMKSMITRGENKGRELTNNFIVLRLAESPLAGHDQKYTAVMPAIVPFQENSGLGVAAWVAETSQLTPLQAVGGWFGGSDNE